MQKLIEILNSKITLESSLNMTNEQKHYLIGLADALQIVKDYASNEYHIGHKYFVIMRKNNIPYIEEMVLYRINKKSKTAYCFTRKQRNEIPTPDLVLYSESGLKMRVYNTMEEAESNKNFVIWRHE